MADINVTINPAPSVSAQVSAAPEVGVSIGEGIPKHAVTHAPGGSDSLEAYYATTGSLAYVSGLTTGIGNTGYLTGYVTKSETGIFYPASNPSGFITGVDLSNYVTGNVVRPSETGSFITQSETGDFYPNSNPSGYITGVDLSGYVTGDVVRPSETGNFITTSQTGVFYPDSNPSGFITGVDLSSYATQTYVTGVSGYLQQQVNNLNNATGEYVTGSVVRPNETGAFLTTGTADNRYALKSATGNFITTSQTGVFASQTYVNNASGYLQTQVTAINNQTGNFALKSQTGSLLTTGAADGRYVSLTGNQTISGDKTFADKLIAKTGFFGDSNSYGNLNSQSLAGGTGNTVSGLAASIGGGRSNQALNNYSVIAGGQNNKAISPYSIVGGGLANISSGEYGSIGGGLLNRVDDTAGVVAGGSSNRVYKSDGAILGGYSNIVSGTLGCVGGGYQNQVLATHGYIGGGQFNKIFSNYGAINGGYFNIVSGQHSNINGGYININKGSHCSIDGGSINQITDGSYNAIGGGFGNYITNSSDSSNIAGGYANTVLNDYANIPGGYGAVADRYGMEARSSSYFDTHGDAQKIAFTLYCDTQFDAKFFLNGLDIFDIFTKSDTSNSAAFVSCQLIGHDSQGNISQIHRKLVIKKEGSVQTIAHLESIGTDLMDAGTVNFSTVGDTFFIEPYGAAYRTYWIAHIYGVEIVRPTEYT
ncbi:MAG: hypothetical protein ACO3GY_07105 [Flavobacteriaceae bacterium]